MDKPLPRSLAGARGSERFERNQLRNAEDAVRGTVVQLGEAFVDANQYVLAFELASVLLLVALVGAIIVARPDVDTDDDEEMVEAIGSTEMGAAESDMMEVEAVELAEPELGEAQAARGGG